MPATESDAESESESLADDAGSREGRSAFNTTPFDEIRGLLESGEAGRAKVNRLIIEVLRFLSTLEGRPR